MIILTNCNWWDNVTIFPFPLTPFKNRYCIEDIKLQTVPTELKMNSKTLKTNQGN